MSNGFFELVHRSKAVHDESTELSTYETPLVTVDIVLFSIIDNSLRVLLIKRKDPPFEHHWALPGGFIHVGETLADAAARILFEETNVKDIYFDQLGAFGAPERDPRARVITISFYALVSAQRLQVQAKDKAEDLGWHCVTDLPLLAFDHEKIFSFALLRLKDTLEIGTSSVAYQLLPEKFTLTELQRVYELIISKQLDKRNFRKKMLSVGILEETGETKMEGYHRPAALYRFTSRSLSAHQQVHQPLRF
ncbi:MAG: NUDIX domain-containing protein [Candidatus Melainabacteria bacterium]